MKITHTLIRKFLENRCNAAEALAVARYLKKHPELMDMYGRSSWKAADQETGLPPGYTEEMLEVITMQIGKNARMVRFRWFAAAASFFILLGGAWLYSLETKQAEKTLATVSKQSVDSVTWKYYSNTSAKAYNIKLEDGSVVTLAPNASIKYQSPFDKDKRILYMQGEADFNVVQDKAKPFTVHAGLFATTALGTSFRISESSSGCNVKLFTGKVLIKALIANLKGWAQDVVLLPGDQMNYDLIKQAVILGSFNNPIKRNGRYRNNTEEISEDGKMIFDNTPLPEVMQALVKKYNTSIEYNEDLLAGKYFSGEVLKEDSLSVLLKVITNMNGLQITEKENGFLISIAK